MRFPPFCQGRVKKTQRDIFAYETKRKGIVVDLVNICVILLI